MVIKYRICYSTTRAFHVFHVFEIQVYCCCFENKNEFILFWHQSNALMSVHPETCFSFVISGNSNHYFRPSTSTFLFYLYVMMSNLQIKNILIPKPFQEKSFGNHVFLFVVMMISNLTLTHPNSYFIFVCHDVTSSDENDLSTSAFSGAISRKPCFSTFRNGEI